MNEWCECDSPAEKSKKEIIIASDWRRMAPFGEGISMYLSGLLNLYIYIYILQS
jgi:hypothetical protein